MSGLMIDGGHRLTGEIKVAGNKNAALPIMAATLLTDEPCMLENVPEIRDVHHMLDLLKQLGKKIAHPKKNLYTISGAVNSCRLDETLAGRLRASILLAAPLLARHKEAGFPPPGGCVIGRRRMDAHFDVFKSFGATVSNGSGTFTVTQTEPVCANLFLKEASVTATANALLLAAATPQAINIENTAAEPHIADLCLVLQKMGASIEGSGSNRLVIRGKKTLSGFQHRIVSDHIEAGTFAIAAAATRGALNITGVEQSHLQMTGHILQQLGVDLAFPQKDVLQIRPAKLVSNVEKIQVGLWPAFPTDLMSPMIVLATQAMGTTLCHDWMFESRMFFVDKLIVMGANITLCDPHRVLVSGPSRLRGQSLSSPDIRAGIALVIAALAAEGRSNIDHAELIDRGYEDIATRLQSIGAHIARQDT